MDTALPPCLSIVGYSDRGGGVSCVHPEMISGSSEYPRNPRILRQGGGELCPSRDDPRIVRVSQESQDTQTGGGGGGELCPSQDDPRIVQVSQESQDTQTGGGGGGRAVSIPG